ncbi:MAG: histidinol-phosphatase [Clostridia bacterium]|nr:histidinol-phosphatase [Clostridia bacterium]
MIKTNFHTHTTFCDGKNTAEEMVIAAIDKGFTHLGFSAHSYTEYDESCGLPLSKMEDYKKEIYRLKEKYKDKIKIYYGIEFDYYSKIDTSEFEYVIASVHGIEKNGKIYIVDESRESLIKNVNEAWGGDYMAFAEDYFETVSKQKGDIIGHIDLLTKFNENDIIFSTKDSRYLNAAKKAVNKLAQSGAIFEINTGAIQRGYRTTPYPSEDILKMIKKSGSKIIINSDCHNTQGIDCDFEKAYEYALKCGFEKSDIIGGNF